MAASAAARLGSAGRMVAYTWMNRLSSVVCCSRTARVPTMSPTAAKVDGKRSAAGPPFPSTTEASLRHARRSTCRPPRCARAHRPRCGPSRAERFDSSGVHRSGAPGWLHPRTLVPPVQHARRPRPARGADPTLDNESCPAPGGPVHIRRCSSAAQMGPRWGPLAGRVIPASGCSIIAYEFPRVKVLLGGVLGGELKGATGAGEDVRSKWTEPDRSDTSDGRSRGHVIREIGGGQVGSTFASRGSAPVSGVGRSYPGRRNSNPSRAGDILVALS